MAAEGLLILAAPAKLTVSLRVTGMRADGYHLLDAEMVTIDLFDLLEVSDGDGLEMVDERGAGLAADPVPVGPDNLVARALRAVDRRARVRLHKRIPSGAGLGGGSADAAAILRWAGVTDPGVAASLGADVPFCLAGGRARVTGVGEEVSPLPWDEVAGAWYTLLTPPLGVSTRRVYQEWDRLGGPKAAGPNHLEPAALSAFPALASWRDRLGGATGQTPVLAGSGGTWWVSGAYPGDGRVVVRAARPEDLAGSEGSAG
jgi:4-diphosphocytidyl-2-C-methyl-D-erythritol kinase